MGLIDGRLLLLPWRDDFGFVYIGCFLTTILCYRPFPGSIGRHVIIKK